MDGEATEADGRVSTPVGPHYSYVTVDKYVAVKHPHFFNCTTYLITGLLSCEFYFSLFV